MATDLLTPRAAALAKQLEFFARTRVEGFLKGGNASRLKGTSTDFLQHRPYLPGDDLRNLDWRVYARSDRLVIREFEEQTNLDVVIGVDFSGSMGFENDSLSKLDFARRCAAMLCYLLARQRDRFGFAALRDVPVHYSRPAASKAHMAEVFRQLVSIGAQGETDMASCVHLLRKQVSRRSVFVFFSDCYQPPEDLTRALGTLRMAGHDVLLYQVFEPAELDLPYNGFTQFRDMETGEVDAADALEIREAYRQVARDHMHALEAGTRRHGIEFHQVATTSDWDAVLAELLHARMARP